MSRPTMYRETKADLPAIATALNGGELVVLATDTLFGIVGRATDRAAVASLYHAKGRSPHKPLIILIHSYDDLAAFGIKVTERVRYQLEEYWPGPYSIVLPDPDDAYDYLHRGTHSLAFRMPAKPWLRELIQLTGPLVAPSANPESHPPATSITEAEVYFGDHVAAYVEGTPGDKPSTLLRLNDGAVEILRP